jgi:hypothetical protein
MLLLIYNTSFGDPDKARIVAHQALEKSHSWPVATRMRATVNVVLAFSFLGLDDENNNLASKAFEECGRKGLIEWQSFLASSSCWTMIIRERLQDAALWFERLEGLSPTYHSPRRRMRFLGCKCELAMATGDVAIAREAFTELLASQNGQSTRAASYVSTIDIRLKMLDSSYRCSDAELRLLREAFVASRTTMHVDYLALALVDALRRAGDVSDAQCTLREYIEVHRRERSPLSPSLVRMSGQLGLPVSA